MSGRALRFLAISGSLRAHSSNAALLRSAAVAVPDGAVLTLFGGLADLPIFNPDLEAEPEAPAVAILRREVREAHGIIIAAPEYAHGIPGGLKNALDWLVSGDEIPDKPVALWHASPRSAISRAALEEVLRTMSTVLVPGASITVPLLGLSPGAITEVLSQPEVQTLLREGLQRFADAMLACRVPAG